MDLEEKRKKIAVFRFGIIADFVTPIHLQYGEKEKLIQQKLVRNYDIPFSKKRNITRSCLLRWIVDYRKSGYRIEGLLPKNRKDKGISKNLSNEFKEALRKVRKEKPNYTINALLKEARAQKILPDNENPSFSSIYRFLNNEGLKKINEEAEDKRRFEAEYPNQIWQSDVMHGPLAIINEKKKKTYLVAIIDDYSRLIVHAEFYPSETLVSLKDCLKKAIEKRGLPLKFYIDNGACFRALNLEHITASLGISITHSRPYVPQGRGKIERWFRYVRDNFLPEYRNIQTIDKLNELLASWIDNYHNRIHGTTNETPYARFRKKLECIRHAPPTLIEHFRMVETRTVKKDRTFVLNTKLFEAPVSLIDRRIDVKYHIENQDNVEIFFQNISYGFAIRLDSHINGKIGRKWGTFKEDPKIVDEIKENEKTEEMKEFKNKKHIKNGELF